MIKTSTAIATVCTQRSSNGTAKVWAVVGTLMLCAGLVACGGGGGSAGIDTAASAAASAQAAVGGLKVTVKDSFGAAVGGATVVGQGKTGTTDAQGVAFLLVEPSARVDVMVSRTTFIDTTVPASVSATSFSEVAVTLLRLTSAAGGSLASRGAAPLVDAARQEMTFEVELVLVDGDSKPIENLRQSDFLLRTCTPAAAGLRVNCVRGASNAADAAYAPTTSTATGLQLIAASPVRPYAAALLMDQSGSIYQSDPSGGRLFSTKAFLAALGPDDRALLSAFAGGPGAKIPMQPLTLYPPFKDRGSAASYFQTLDGLGSQIGGNTPLYDALDALRQTVVSDTSLPAGISKAAVVFTDGADTSCADVSACRARRAQVIQKANADQIRLFTIGLSGSVDVAALGELASQTGGAFLYAETAEQLLPLYGSVGKLLSLGLPTYRLQWTVRAGAPGGFQPGSSLLGRVQVTSGSRTFDVPFIVGIP